MKKYKTCSTPKIAMRKAEILLMNAKPYLVQGETNPNPTGKEWKSSVPWKITEPGARTLGVSVHQRRKSTETSK